MARASTCRQATKSQQESCKTTEQGRLTGHNSVGQQAGMREIRQGLDDSKAGAEASCQQIWQGFKKLTVLEVHHTCNGSVGASNRTAALTLASYFSAELI